jgi:hypothetical protein
MIRGLGISLLAVFSVGLSLRAEAQMAADYGPNAVGGASAAERVEPYGGFGLETAQTPVSGGAALDRFGMIHAMPSARPAALVSVPDRRNKTNPMARYTQRGRAARAGHQLTTGSLEWGGADRVLLFSPEVRHRSYGGGYGQGPYGSFDCGMMYKGMWLGD